MKPVIAYYNEIDPYAAQWLRNLIEAGHIAPGFVDERSIEDINPEELNEYTQCHFFAGIGVWSYALRQAGWDDSRPVWTGSCPCQPFSTAGKGAGFADERHLWPSFQHLIAECKPAIVFGEQVASKAVDDWIDLVQDDMEALGYAFGAVPFPSAGVGAPHIRDRTYWLAHADVSGEYSLLWSGSEHTAKNIWSGQTIESLRHLAGRTPQHERVREDGPQQPSPTNGFWRDADWLGCRDERWRPVEPGTFPLVDGSAGRMGRSGADQERIASLPRKDQGSRVGRLKGYGNAINAQAAKAFIESFM